VKTKNATDSDVSVQTSRYEASDECQYIPNVLPRLFGNSLKGERQSELALERVDVEPIQEVYHCNENLGTSLESIGKQQV